MYKYYSKHCNAIALSNNINGDDDGDNIFLRLNVHYRDKVHTVPG